MYNIVLKTNNKVNVEKIIRGKIHGFFSDVEKPFFKVYSIDKKQICFFIAEDHSLSTNSRLTISLVGESTEDSTTINVFVSGGKVGLLYAVSYGSEKRRAKKIVEILSEYGFKVIKDDNF